MFSLGPDGSEGCGKAMAWLAVLALAAIVVLAIVIYQVVT